MNQDQLQEACERGQAALMQTEYREAERILEEAEAETWRARDWDTLARVYMPLQETRRQIRLRCGEGVVHLGLLATGPHDQVQGERVVENYPSGQLLVAGWGTIKPAVDVRRLARERGLYVETFLGAVFPTDEGHVVVIAPRESDPLPDAGTRSITELQGALPPHCLVLRESELTPGPRKGSAQTFAEVAAIWERLHLPFVMQADEEQDLFKRMEKYRATIEVDPACEFAHQRLSNTARQLWRQQRAG